MDNNLKPERMKKGLTQQELAEAVGTNRFTIQNIENKNQVPNAKLAAKIAAFLKKLVEDIFKLTDNDKV